MSIFASLNLLYYAYCVGVLVNLENRQTRIKLMFAYLKHSLLVGVHRCLDCLGISLKPLKNFSEHHDPDKIAQKRIYGFIMLGSSG